MIDDDDKQFKVNCLLRDMDAYFMGFQRDLVLSEEEQGLEEKKRMERNPEASSSKGKKKKKKTEEASLLKGKKKTEEQSEKGNFYRFKERDMMVPEFLNATKLNVEAGYRKRLVLISLLFCPVFKVSESWKRFQFCPSQSNH
jgi:hypothetical protein